MEKHSIEPENTRVRKTLDGTKLILEVLQASAGTNAIINHLTETTFMQRSASGVEITPRRCRGFVPPLLKSSIMSQATSRSPFCLIISSFGIASLKAYRNSQKTWVTDISSRVENILGFVEPYRDSYGVRAEWEGAVCISDPDEASELMALVDGSTALIRTLPWADLYNNDGKGPFEANLFLAADFAIVHCG